MSTDLYRATVFSLIAAAHASKIKASFSTASLGCTCMAQLRLIALRVLAGLLVFALVGGSMHFLNPDVSVPPIVWAVSAGVFAMAFVLWGQPLRFVPWRPAGRLGTWLSYPLSIACVAAATYALWLMLAAQAPISAP